MADDTVKGSKKTTSANTQVNAISFLVDQIIKDTVNTAEVVRIDSADSQSPDSTGGYGIVTPLVTQADGFDNALQATALPNMPIYRPQAGKAAIIMEPQPGDKGLAIFTKRDSSGVKTGQNDPTRPASFRNFDQADGFIINGFLGETPEIYLVLDPVSGDITLSTKSANVNISCRDSGDIDIKTGSGNINVTAGNGGSGTITLDGRVEITRTLTVHNRDGEGPSHMTGGFINTGGFVRTNNVTVETHTHSGVESGSSNTNQPNVGT